LYYKTSFSNRIAILTVQEAGNGNQKIPDEDVLAFATNRNRVVLTLNRYDFIRLHKQSACHAGIVVCSENNDFDLLANKIHEAVCKLEYFNEQLIRIYRDA
jgi:predicted nuclease of predicted toxin-antitoxin system